MVLARCPSASSHQRLITPVNSPSKVRVNVFITAGVMEKSSTRRSDGEARSPLLRSAKLLLRPRQVERRPQRRPAPLGSALHSKASHFNESGRADAGQMTTHTRTHTEVEQKCFRTHLNFGECSSSCPPPPPKYNFKV